MITLKSLLNENNDVNTFQMYHGGTRWQGRGEVQPGSKGRYEAGVGIYLTTHYLTARKYAKGGKVVQLVSVDKNFKDITTVDLPIQLVVDFLKSLNGLKKRKEIIQNLISYVQRVKRGDVIPAEVINNLFVNYEAGAGNSGIALTKFFVQNGIDASVSNQSGNEQWMVVFNPQIIKTVSVMPPNIPMDKYELPRISND